jgi:glycerophosphoryl diester phosphodiesterase
MEQELQIVCHRGFNHIAPENTLIAAQLCFDRGYDFVELDLRTTADGQLVVFHDETLNRTTSGSGRLADKTWNELSGLDAGSWFHPKYADQRIPLFRQMLGLLQQGSGGLYIELKGANPAKMLREITEAGVMDRCFFGSEQPEVMREVRRLAPQAVLMARRRDFASFRETVEDCRSQIIEFDQTVDDLSELPLCRDFGVQSMIYDRTDSKTKAQALIDRGPDLVNVDRPDIFAALLGRS